VQFLLISFTSVPPNSVLDNDQEYWRRLERNWRQWKGRKVSKRRTLEMVREEKEIEQEDLGVKE